MREHRQTVRRCGGGKRGFSLAELLVVAGIIALLFSITVPTLNLARRQAQEAQCAVHLQQQGYALEMLNNNHDGFYPLWDDNGAPTRYTWIDVLVQVQALGNHRAGYCPADKKPDPLNEARAAPFGLYYPGAAPAPGVDYSYGIGVPLSAGGWAWQRSFSPEDDRDRDRLFWNHEDHPAQRLLAADASWTYIYNFSGDYVYSGVWNYPTQHDNTIAWLRHPRLRANVLFQDGHVEPIQYQPKAREPVDTTRYFVWQLGEDLHVGPDHPDLYREGNWYPNVPPIAWDDEESLGGVFPSDLIPHWYTAHGAWTHIGHKW